MGMTGSDQPSGAKPTREQRLASRLRANLRRRKAQARARDAGEPGGEPTMPGTSLPKREDGG